MTSLKAIISVKDEQGDLIARFVYADDAVLFCTEMHQREPSRLLHLEDKAGFYNIFYGPWKKVS